MNSSEVATLGLAITGALIALLTFVSNQRDLRRKANKDETAELRRERDEARKERDELHKEVEGLRFQATQQQYANYQLYQKIDKLEKRVDDGT